MVNLCMCSLLYYYKSRNKKKITLTNEQQTYLLQVHIKVYNTNAETFQIHRGPYQSKEVTNMPSRQSCSY